MINELIPPDTLAPQLQNWLSQLNAALAQLKKAPKNTPSGHLRVAQKGGKGPYFYHYTSSQDFNGKYIRKKQLPLAKALAQKDYTLKLIKLLEKESHALSEYLTQSKNGTAIQGLYKSLCLPARIWLPQPLSQTKNLQLNGKMSPGRASPLQQMLRNTTQQMEKLCVPNQK